MRKTVQRLTVCAAAVGLAVLPVWLRAQDAQPPVPQAAGAEAVPADLKPLLASTPNEFEIVSRWYNTDRNTLSGNYDSGRAPVVRDGGPTQLPIENPPPSFSLQRIARLKRFDLQWQAALGKLDASRLSPPARTSLTTLTGTIAKNLAQLDADTATISLLMPLVPFAPSIVSLSDAQLRIADLDPQKAAGELVTIAKQVDQIRDQLEAGLKSTQRGGMLVPAEDAKTAAAAVDALRSSLATWFNFYNGYDPLFTWWTDMPYQHASVALERYSLLLGERASSSGAILQVDPVVIPPVQPAAGPSTDVPDLQALITLPRDEMAPVVQRFLASPGGGRGATNSPAAGRSRDNYQAWLAALKTLDFARLSRNAQVDYLFIRNTAERQIARLETVPQANPPRKTDNTGIPGNARGRQGIVLDLADELIPYSPEELLTLANRDLAWCEEEMKKASREMGFGDDWKKAVEKVKTMYVAPGKQPTMVRDLLYEAIEFVRTRDLITVPPIAAESLHMSMMTPEAQLSNPFFLGGARMIVSYPTSTMEYDARLQSMRGNNVPFAHATAFHEMIPGHNLVGFVGARYNGYRARLGAGTPFFAEGWPLYWELQLYDLGFNRTPEERVGALFWRMHRGARIIFSLRFHLGEWSPQECIDFLVERVGHERDNATAEVRRSFQGGYGPLYQAAYLLGGLQLRGLARDLVGSGKMTSKQFHDEVLRQGSMPIALIRLALSADPLTPDMSLAWKFYGELN